MCLPDGVILLGRMATLAYREARLCAERRRIFSEFRAAEGTRQQGTRQPGQILAHLCGLLDWALKLAGGTHERRGKPPQSWERDTARLFAGLEALDQRLGSGAPLGGRKVIRRPIADTLTHTG
jgi:hypothetical protein